MPIFVLGVVLGVGEISADGGSAISVSERNELSMPLPIFLKEVPNEVMTLKLAMVGGVMVGS
jgi:hypothetical protein